jgi:quaternary ammonium compound-resistance protein SugE
MRWVVLLASSLLEAVWASALGASEGLTRPVPTAVFVVAMCLSMVGLSIALRGIAVGTAYAVWTGLGGALTVTYSMATGAEPVTMAKAALLALLMTCVVVLNLVDHRATDGTIPPGSPT